MSFNNCGRGGACLFGIGVRSASIGPTTTFVDMQQAETKFVEKDEAEAKIVGPMSSGLDGDAIGGFCIAVALVVAANVSQLASLIKNNVTSISTPVRRRCRPALLAMCLCRQTFTR